MNKFPSLQLIDDKPHAFDASLDSQIKHAEMLQEIHLLCSGILSKELYLEWEDSDKKLLKQPSRML